MDWQAIVDGCTSGDAQAWHNLVQATRTTVEQTAAAMCKNRLLAEDVAQESFVLIVENLHRLKDVNKIGGWIRQIVRTTAFRHMKTRDVQLSLIDDVYDPVCLESGNRAKLRGVVRNAVSGLPDRERTVTILHYYRGFSYEEISHQLATTNDSVRGLLRRARIRLREDAPKMAQSTIHFRLESDDLRTLKYLASVTTNTENHPAIQGVLIEPGGTAVATDGRRFVRRRIEAFSNNEVPLLLGPWANTGALFDSRNAIVSIQSSLAVFEADGTIVEMSVLEHTFPKYEEILPRGDGFCSLKLTLNELEPISRVVASISQTESRLPAVIEVSADKVVFELRPTDSSARIRVETPVSVEVDGLLRLAVETRYWLSAIESLEPSADDQLTVTFFGESAPIRFAAANSDTEYGLVAPMQHPA